MDKKQEDVKFLAYGSLRKGEYNFDRFGDNSLNYIETIKVKGYKMYNLGECPAIIHTGKEDHIIECDILSTSKDIFNMIENMEYRAGYVLDNRNIAPIFIMTISPKRWKLKEVKSGNWKLKN